MDRGYIRAKREIADRVDREPKNIKDDIRLVIDRNQTYDWLHDASYAADKGPEFWNWLRFGAKGTTIIASATIDKKPLHWIMLAD